MELFALVSEVSPFPTNKKKGVIKKKCVNEVTDNYIFAGKKSSILLISDSLCFYWESISRVQRNLKYT